METNENTYQPPAMDPLHVEQWFRPMTIEKRVEFMSVFLRRTAEDFSSAETNESMKAEALEQLRSYALMRESMELLTGEAMRAARRRGATHDQIAGAVGLTRQAVIARLKKWGL